MSPDPIHALEQGIKAHAYTEGPQEKKILPKAKGETGLKGSLGTRAQSGG